MAGTANGSIRGAARRIGVSEHEYLRRRAAGESWCTRCKAWHPASVFGRDSARPSGIAASCLASRRRHYEATYVPKGPPERYGPLPSPPRSGDRRQARQRINVEVRTGRRPHPNSLPCSRCGHVWTDGERRHEYHHHLGYEAEHHYDVVVLCATCHAKEHDG